jgi:hypothetical protein
MYEVKTRFQSLLLSIRLRVLLRHGCGVGALHRDGFVRGAVDIPGLEEKRRLRGAQPTAVSLLRAHR